MIEEYNLTVASAGRSGGFLIYACREGVPLNGDGSIPNFLLEASQSAEDYIRKHRPLNGIAEIKITDIKQNDR